MESGRRTSREVLLHGLVARGVQRAPGRADGIEAQRDQRQAMFLESTDELGGVSGHGIDELHRIGTWLGDELELAPGLDGDCAASRQRTVGHPGHLFSRDGLAVVIAVEHQPLHLSSYAGRRAGRKRFGRSADDVGLGSHGRVSVRFVRAMRSRGGRDGFR